jgi:hypothetical protein
LNHLKDQCRGHGEGRDHRQINAASNDYDRHPQAQNAESGHVLEQRDHVVGRKEPGEEKRKAPEEQHENAKDDALLRDPLLPHFFCPWAKSYCPTVVLSNNIPELVNTDRGGLPTNCVKDWNEFRREGRHTFLRSHAKNLL